MQCLGTCKENDPFGEKRIPPSYFVVTFDSVLLQCVNICVCVTEETICDTRRPIRSSCYNSIIV